MHKTVRKGTIFKKVLIYNRYLYIKFEVEYKILESVLTLRTVKKNYKLLFYTVIDVGLNKRNT